MVLDRHNFLIKMHGYQNYLPIYFFLFFLIFNSLFSWSNEPITQSEYGSVKIKVDEFYYNIDKEYRTASVTYESDDLSNNYPDLQVVNIPSHIIYENSEYSVVSISRKAFFFSQNIKEVFLPEGLLSVGNYAFEGCSALQQLSIGESLIDIGEYAFEGCKSLSRIVSKAIIPPGIENSTFDLDTYHDALLLVSENSKNSYKVADNWRNFENIISYKGGTDSTDDYFYIDGLYYYRWLDGVRLVPDYYNNYSDFKTIKIPEKVKYNNKEYKVLWIDDFTFNNCSQLVRIEIPSTIVEIGSNNFFDCPYLSTISVSPENLHYSSEEGVLYTDDWRTLVRFPSNNAVYPYYSILSGIKTIQNRAFEDCKLIEVFVPSSVMQIGSEAFKNSYDLTAISFMNEEGDILISDNVFDGCMALSSIYNYSKEPPQISKNTFDNIQPPFIYLIGSPSGWIEPSENNSEKLMPWRLFPPNNINYTAGYYIGKFNFPANPIFRFYTALDGWDSHSYGAGIEDSPVEFPDFNGSDIFTNKLTKGKSGFYFPDFEGGDVTICIDFANNIIKIYRDEFIPNPEDCNIRNLYVLEGCKEIYENSVGWSSFGNIVDNLFIPPFYVELDYYNLTLGINNKFQLNCYPYPSNCTFPVEWLSTDERIATVSETGLIETKSVGYTQIIARCGDKEAACSLYVEDEAGIKEISQESLSFNIKNGTIKINDSMACGSIEIYDLLGRKVYEGTQSTISGLPLGSYILKYGNKSFKIIL